MKTIAGLFLVLLLTGCATSQDTGSKGPPAQVTVYREPSPRDSLFPMLFIIDGHPVFQLQPEEARSFELPRGITGSGMNSASTAARRGYGSNPARPLSTGWRKGV